MNDFSAVQRLLDLEARLWVSREHAGPPVEGGVRLVGVLGWNAAVRLRAYRQEIEATW
jgi:hypothetical protein